MPQQRTRRSQRVSFLPVLALMGLLAAPAHAGSEFDDGFEDQLGRLFAYEAFSLGKWIVGSAYAHAAQPHGYGYGAPYSGAYEDHDHPGPAYESEYEERYSRDGRDPCEYTYHERVRRNRYGEVVEYERREVRRRRGRYDD